jgi:hypothetical protein
MAEEIESKRMGWEELSRTPEFATLTKKQQLFMCTYISNGYNEISAIRTAYNCKNDNSAKVMSYPLLRNFNICLVLSIHFGSDQREAFLARLQRDIAKGNISDSLLRAYTLYAEVRGWHGYGNAKPRSTSEKIEAQVEPEKKSEPNSFDLSGFER